MKYYTWSEDYDWGDTIIDYNSIEKLLKELKEHPEEYKSDKIIVGEEMSVEEFLRRNQK